MSNKEVVLNALKGYKVEMINTPLDNEFVLDGKWLVEMDRDGAFAAVVSCLGATGPYNETHTQVVFSSDYNESPNGQAESITKQLNKAIATLSNNVA